MVCHSAIAVTPAIIMIDGEHDRRQHHCEDEDTVEPSSTGGRMFAAVDAAGRPDGLRHSFYRSGIRSPVAIVDQSGLIGDTNVTSERWMISVGSKPVLTDPQCDFRVTLRSGHRPVGRQVLLVQKLLCGPLQAPVNFLPQQAKVYRLGKQSGRSKF
jgi:hypothetical protein